MQETTTTLAIRRYDPADGRRWVQEYTIPVRPGMTVLEALWHIVHHVDGSLSFRYSCRGAVCGSCAMRINDVITLACHTQVASLLPGPIAVAPLPRMTVLKDLVVDMDAFLAKFRSIQPYLVRERSTEAEMLQSPEARRRIFDSVKCILCASCHAACPLTGIDTDYLGPAVLTAAHRFAFDDRNDARGAALDGINTDDGARTCRTISRCTEVCPKHIAPSVRIKELKHSIRRRSAAKRAESKEEDTP
jgi:succinate dehydrogenase / fumarate reductase iron-sulfur subunit